MTTERTLDINYQNLENVISEILKEEPYAKVVNAYVQKGILTIVFEEDDRKRKHPSFVLQVSKKKYEYLGEYFQKVRWKRGIISCKVETDKNWLVFYEKQ